MAQTRAISRACRSAFAHVVVMIDRDLSTTPAEEAAYDGFDSDQPARIEEPSQDATVWAMNAAIDSCADRHSMRRWKRDNDAALGQLSAANSDAVIRHFNARWKELPAKQGRSA